LKKIVLAAAGLCCIQLAWAQSAADRERMERAKRDASNPLRIIIEASQVKRTKAAEAAPAAPPAPAARAPAAPAERAVAERRPAGQADPATEPAIRAVAAQSVPTPAAAVTSGPANPASVPAASVETAPPAASNAAPVEATASLTAAPPAAAPPTAALAAPAAAAAAAAAPNPAQPATEVLMPLKLVHYIEPEIPVRIRARLRPSNEVMVAFKVLPDGSVSNVDIRSTTARALDPVVLEAVRQWRYDPVPAAREHTVQLVFNLSE
jgi:TonB family protein